MNQQQLKPAPTRSDSQVERAYARLARCTDDGGRITAAAGLILAIFDDFYSLLCEYPYRAKCAFETMDPHASIRISKERLGLYSRYIEEHGPRLRAAFPALAHDSGIWDALDRLFVAMIVDRYEADIAFSFAHSLQHELDALAAMAALCDDAGVSEAGMCGKLRRLRLHRIAAEDSVAGLHDASPLRTDLPFIHRLRTAGQEAAADWLASDTGQREPPNLSALAAAAAPRAQVAR